MAPASDPGTNGKNGSKPADAAQSPPAPQPGAAPQPTGAPAQPNQGGPADPNASKPAATQSSDPTPEKSAGADNPNQPGADPTTGKVGLTDGQGHAGREGEEAFKAGEARAAATVGATVTGTTPGRPPSESAGFSPPPDDRTGEADSDRTPYTQAGQRIVHPADMHPMAEALGHTVNIPPGSRPMMLDPQTGIGLVPPQAGTADAEDAARARDDRAQRHQDREDARASAE